MQNLGGVSQAKGPDRPKPLARNMPGISEEQYESSVPGLVGSHSEK